MKLLLILLVGLSALLYVHASHEGVGLPPLPKMTCYNQISYTYPGQTGSNLGREIRGWNPFDSAENEDVQRQFEFVFFFSFFFSGCVTIRTSSSHSTDPSPSVLLMPARLETSRAPSPRAPSP